MQIHANVVLLLLCDKSECAVMRIYLQQLLLLLIPTYYYKLEVPLVSNQSSQNVNLH
jgi:hypothetical protein